MYNIYVRISLKIKIKSSLNIKIVILAVYTNVNYKSVISNKTTYLITDYKL